MEINVLCVNGLSLLSLLTLAVVVVALMWFLFRKATKPSSPPPEIPAELKDTLFIHDLLANLHNQAPQKPKRGVRSSHQIASFFYFCAAILLVLLVILIPKKPLLSIGDSITNFICGFFIINPSTPTPIISVLPTATMSETTIPVSPATASHTAQPTFVIIDTLLAWTETARAMTPPAPWATPGQCIAKATKSGVEIHVGPGTNRPARYSVLDTFQAPILGQNIDVNGNLWYSLDMKDPAENDRYWIRASDVTLTGDCGSIPPAPTSPVVTPIPDPPTATPAPTQPAPNPPSPSPSQGNPSPGEPTQPIIIPSIVPQIIVQPISPTATFTPTPPPPSGPLSVSDCHENCDPARCRAYLSTQGYNDVHFGSSRASCALSTMTCDCLWR